MKSETDNDTHSSDIEKSIKQLEDEFRALLEEGHRPNFDQNVKKTKQSSLKSNNHDTDRCFHENDNEGPEEQFPMYSSEAVLNMNRIATTMISSGFDTECGHVYSITRRSAFKEELKRLGLETISIDDIHRMQWESLETVIAVWINVLKQCAAVLFPGERKLCGAIFSVHSTISHSMFNDIAHPVVKQVLSFAEAVALTKRATEKLFKFLDMREALRDLSAAIEDGSFEACCPSELILEISNATNRLGEAAVSIFCELENSIKSDNGKQPVPSGAVHPLTRYTMNYLKYACDEYRDTLEEVFKHHKKINEPDGESKEPAEPAENGTPNHQNHNETIKHSPFAGQLIQVMELLDMNLDIKSKLYRDHSLSYIFLMNNGRYILQKIKGSTEIHEMVGNTWCRKRSSDLRQYHKNYQRETWGRLLGCISHEGLQVNGKVCKPMLKERFKSFNAMFDDIHKTQSTWVVSDEQLKSELRISISAVVIPAYRSFLGRFSQHLDGGRHSDKYIKYQPDDIEKLVDDLFEGTPASMNKRRG